LSVLVTIGLLASPIGGMHINTIGLVPWLGMLMFCADLGSIYKL
jgi:hypothetical protein